MARAQGGTASVDLGPGDRDGRRGWKQVPASLAHRARCHPRQVAPTMDTAGRSDKATSVSTETPNPSDSPDAVRRRTGRRAGHPRHRRGARRRGDHHRRDAPDERRRGQVRARRGAGRRRAPRPGRGPPADQRARRAGHGGRARTSAASTPLRCATGCKSLQLAFREASVIPDPPGQGPGREAHRLGRLSRRPRPSVRTPARERAGHRQRASAASVVAAAAAVAADRRAIVRRRDRVTPAPPTATSRPSSATRRSRRLPAPAVDGQRRPAAPPAPNRRS